MSTNLTLKINKRVIKIAQKYAQKKGSSLPVLVEHYLKTLGADENLSEKMTARVTRLRGAVKLPSGLDYKKVIGENLTKKHIK